MTEKNTKQT